ncbi:MAG: toxin-antitoxin system YwqK family antitoxin [Vicinamibacterales bacterium]
MKALALVLVLVATQQGGPPPLEVVRTFYPSGQPYEVRHFRNGQEEGLQQAWTADGTLYINYEMRNGRRYGFINARPCRPVEEQP